MTDTTRRNVLAGAAGISAAAALSACTRKDESPSDAATGSAQPTGKNSTSATASSSAGAAGAALANVADIPVGGGKIFAKEKVVVTQPTAGTIKAFSSTCTHQGCPVTDVKNGTINCSCHGSKYKVADGSVSTGPATKALPAVKVTVANGKITLA
jgi:Rieske Fe-S protein